jgi:TPR repeat protein
MLAQHYHHRTAGLQQNHAKAVELYARAAYLGCSDAHCNLGNIYREGGYLKKASFHYEAAAMAGHKIARHAIGLMEFESGNIERAMKHWTIAASAGDYISMQNLIKGIGTREAINSTLAAYNNSCSE